MHSECRCFNTLTVCPCHGSVSVTDLTSCRLVHSYRGVGSSRFSAFLKCSSVSVQGCRIFPVLSRTHSTQGRVRLLATFRNHSMIPTDHRDGNSGQSSHPPRLRSNSLPVGVVPWNGRDVQPQVQVAVGTTVEFDLGFLDLNNTISSRVGDEEGGIYSELQEKNMEILCTKPE
jgi:hypothetical protein